MKRALSFGIGCWTGGAVLGAVLALVGSRLLPWPIEHLLVMLGLLSVLYALGQLGFAKLPFPERTRTVSVQWGRSGPRGMAIWGLTNGGLGFVTQVSFPGYYVVLALLLVIGEPVYGSLVGFVYGFARSLPLLVVCIPRDLKQRPFHEAVMSIISLRGRFQLANGIGLALFGTGVLTFSLTQAFGA